MYKEEVKKKSNFELNKNFLLLVSKYSSFYTDIIFYTVHFSSNL